MQVAYNVLIPPMMQKWLAGKFMNDLKKPIHPGEILADQIAEIGISATALAIRLGVPTNRIYQILNKQRIITADTALRLGKFFGTGAEFWLNLQKAYELELAQQQIGQSLESIIPYRSITVNKREALPAGT